MKILYLDPVLHTATSQEYRYYNGLFDELVKIKDCKVLVHQGVVTDMSIFVNSYDAIIFGLGWFSHKFYGEIKNLNTPSVCIIFKPQNDLDEKLEFCRKNKIDRILTPVPNTKQYEEKTGIETLLFPYGHCPDTFYPREDVGKSVDIGFSGALHEKKHYPAGAFVVENIRTKIGENLNSMSGVDVFWNSSDDSPSRITSYEEYAKKICSSKMWIATQAAFGDITPRYYEILSSGTLLLCQKIPEEYSDIFIHEVNCVEFQDDLSDLEEKVLKFSADNELRNRITSRAIADSSSHTWAKRAEKLIEILGEIR